MAKLVIEGDRKHLEIIARENRLRVSKYDLKISLESKEQEVVEGPPVKTDSLNVAQTIELIDAVTDIADLDRFDSDDRVTVQRAATAKREELTLK